MSIPLKARRDFAYAGHRIKKGQDFDARSASDARLLKAIGHAEDRAQTYSTRMMTAATPAPVSIPQSEPKDWDDLDGMDSAALHALAARLGLYIHHRVGAERARQAIRDYRKSEAE